MKAKSKTWRLGLIENDFNNHIGIKPSKLITKLKMQ